MMPRGGMVDQNDFAQHCILQCTISCHYEQQTIIRHWTCSAKYTCSSCWVRVESSHVQTSASHSPTTSCKQANKQTSDNDHSVGFRPWQRRACAGYRCQHIAAHNTAWQSCRSSGLQAPPGTSLAWPAAGFAKQLNNLKSACRPPACNS